MTPRSLRPVLPLVALLGACGDNASTQDAALDARTDAASDASTDSGSDAAVDAGPTLRPVTVTTTRGAVVGRADGRARAFLGVPYAAPPVGALRWRAPVEAPAWMNMRDASERGAACLQSPGSAQGMLRYSEDCLNLNVWTPDATATTGRPVMVFIHGGGFTGGSGSEPVYDGRALAARGGVVVVSFNYRLNRFGFLAHPALSAEDTAHHSSGNYGFQDQQMALTWVRDNIAAFGGDPGNVTLFGESAGSLSVCTHLLAPASRGLFHKAILESGVCSVLVNPLRDTTPPTFESAESLGREFAQALGCGAATDVAACMRAMPADTVETTLPRSFELSLRARYIPNIDGYVIPDAPARMLRMGMAARVPVMLGTNRDEGTFFALTTPTMTDAEFDAAVRAITPDHVADVRRVYPMTTYRTLREAYSAFVADAVFVCPTRLAARQLAQAEPRTFLYHFTRLNPQARLLQLGVFHTAELPYVFSNFLAPFSGEGDDQAISDLAVGYWSRFAATGDPNGAGAPAWARYTATADAHLEIGDTTAAGTGLHRAACDEVERWLPVQ